MPFTIVLTSECLPADGADEWSFVCMSPQMGPEIVGSGEALGAKMALESSRVFLNTLGIIRACSGPLRVRETQNIIAVVNR